MSKQQERIQAIQHALKIVYERRDRLETLQKEKVSDFSKEQAQELNATLRCIELGERILKDANTGHGRTH